LKIKDKIQCCDTDLSSLQDDIVHLHMKLTLVKMTRC